MLVVTIDRQQRRNALHGSAHGELAEVFDCFAANSALRVAVLTGAGDQAFCAGNDLKATPASGESTTPPTGFGGLTHRFDLLKPVIAAVNGAAAGGGLELALACDVIVAAEHARFSLPEVRVGLAALAGGLLRLPSVIGEKRAAAMALTGDAITAQEALAYGLVHDVVPLAGLMPAALRLAEHIAAASPVAVRASKAVLRAGASASVEAGLATQLDLPAVHRLLASDHQIEGARAFAEKRPPRWADD